MDKLPLPPFWDHSLRGAAVGAVLGGTIASVGWVIRQRNGQVVDLGEDAPSLLARYRPIAETLLHFKEVSNVSSVSKRLYKKIIKDCEFIASNDTATGGKQVEIQKRLMAVKFHAKQLASEAFKMRHVHCHDCALQIDTLDGQLSGIQKNMMMT